MPVISEDNSFLANEPCPLPTTLMDLFLGPGNKKKYPTGEAIILLCLGVDIVAPAGYCAQKTWYCTKQQ